MPRFYVPAVASTEFIRTIFPFYYFVVKLDLQKFAP